jgi:ribosomal protein S18 acetylase RimI-like enzyme
MAGEKDCSSITSVALAAYAVYLERMPTKPFPMLDDYSGYIKNEQVYVLEYENAVCGYVVLIKKDFETLLLDNIAVLPASQGKGYGRCLTQFAEEYGRKYGFNRICLYTNEVMTENLFWYQRLGYSVTHNAVENGYRRIYMAKALS